jgi:hypothetical protein
MCVMRAAIVLRNWNAGAAVQLFGHFSGYKLFSTSRIASSSDGSLYFNAFNAPDTRINPSYYVSYNFGRAMSSEMCVAACTWINDHAGLVYSLYNPGSGNAAQSSLHCSSATWEEVVGEWNQICYIGGAPASQRQDTQRPYATFIIRS